MNGSHGGTIPILNASGVLAIEMAKIYFYDSAARGEETKPKGLNFLLNCCNLEVHLRSFISK